MLAYTNGFTLWHYIEDDTPIDLSKAKDLLRAGDVIWIQNTVETYSVFVKEMLSGNLVYRRTE